jgi:hypothetical protein
MQSRQDISGVFSPIRNRRGGTNAAKKAANWLWYLVGYHLVPSVSGAGHGS